MIIKDSSGWIKDIISIQNFESSIYKLIDQISKSRKKYTNIYAIPRGGLVIGVWLSHYLDIPMLSKLNLASEEKILIVDDIADTGETLAQLPSWFNTATLYYKKRSIIKPTFYAEETENWIVFPYEKYDEKVNREVY